MNRKRRRFAGAIFWPMLVILLLGFGLRVVALDTLPLIGDEAYYRLWSKHPAPSYYDHPAGTALMIRLSTALAGDGEFGIRWFNATLGFLTAVLTVAVGRRMLSPRAGAFAGGLVALGAPFLIVGRFVYTDALHLFGILLNIWAFDRLITEKRSRLDASGVLFGLTLILLFNTKYSAYLYAAALGGWVLLQRRSLFRDQGFWVGIGMGVIGLLPVVLWNAAHNWISFRWQLSHFGLSSPGAHAPSLALRLLANTQHAWAYLTPPVFLAGIAGLGSLRRTRERLLTLVALGMLLPVIVSAANSPRNLTTGWVLLMMMAGERVLGSRVADSFRQGRIRTGGVHRLAVGVGVLLFLSAGIYGVGTVMALSGREMPVRSSVVADILQDTVGWRGLGEAFGDWSGSILTLDYSLAGQITYYADRQAVTPWGQYLLWDWPLSDPMLVVSLEYLPVDCVNTTIRGAFMRVEGPLRLRVEDKGVVRKLWLWQAYGLQLTEAELFQRLDFLTLQEACR